MAIQYFNASFFLLIGFASQSRGFKNWKGKKEFKTEREGWLILLACGTLIIASESCKLAAISSTYGTCAIHLAL